MELLLLGNKKSKRQASGSWRAYLAGTKTPYNGRAPAPPSRWARLAALACPGSWPWFATPFWYLLEDREFLPGQIVQCAELLPEHFSEGLLYQMPVDSVRASMRLKSIDFDWVYEFTEPLGPWSLGATACAMRRAELAGAAPEMRWTAAGLIWQIDTIAAALDPWIAEPLLEVRALLLERYRSMVYRDGLRLPVEQADIERFGRTREAYLVWLAEDPTVPGASSWPLLASSA